MDDYKISFSSGNLKFEVSSVEKSWVDEKIKEYSEYIDKIISAEHRNSSESKPSEQKSINRSNDGDVYSKMSINEFYRAYIAAQKIKSRPDIATFFVFYLTKTSDKNEFTSGDVKDLFREIQYPNWNKINITDTLNQAKKRALLNNVNNAWALSLMGEEFVLNKLSNNE